MIVSSLMTICVLKITLKALFLILKAIFALIKQKINKKLDILIFFRTAIDQSSGTTLVTLVTLSKEAGVILAQPAHGERNGNRKDELEK